MIGYFRLRTLLGMAVAAWVVTCLGMAVVWTIRYDDLYCESRCLGTALPDRSLLGNDTTTATPTLAPTGQDLPSDAPTGTPTSSPSEAPSEAPSSRPSISPTRSPTELTFCRFPVAEPALGDVKQAMYLGYVMVVGGLILSVVSFTCLYNKPHAKWEAMPPLEKEFDMPDMNDAPFSRGARGGGDTDELSPI